MSYELVKDITMWVLIVLCVLSVIFFLYSVIIEKDAENGCGCLFVPFVFGVVSSLCVKCCYREESKQAEMDEHKRKIEWYNSLSPEERAEYDYIEDMQKSLDEAEQYNIP